MSVDAPERGGAAQAAALAPGGPPPAGLARRIFAGTGVITLASAGVRALGVLSAPVLTVLLGPEPYGEAALVSTLVALVASVALLGIDLAYTRFYFGGVSEDAAAVERFCWRAAVTAATVVSALSALAWVFLLAPRTGASRAMGVVVGAGGLLFVLNSMAQVRARLRGRYLRLSVAILLNGLASIALMVVLAAWWRRDAWPLLLGTVGGVAVGAAIAGLPGLRDLLRPSGLSREQRGAVLRLGLPGVGTAVMYWVLSSADRWVIGASLPGEVLGSYSFAANLAVTGLMLNSAIVMVWFPEASRTFEQERAQAPAALGRLWTRMAVLLALVWLAVDMAGGDVLRLLADPRFHGGAVYIPWIAAGVFFYGVAALGSTGMMLARDARAQPAWWLVGVALSVALNLALVPRYGALAAAVTQCASFAVIAAGVLWSSERGLSLDILWGRLLAIVGVVGVLGALGAPAWAPTPLASLALKLPVGIAASAAVVAWAAPDWARRGVDRLRGRGR